MAVRDPGRPPARRQDDQAARRATGPQPFRAVPRLLRRPQPAQDDDLVLPRAPAAAGSPRYQRFGFLDRV